MCIHEIFAKKGDRFPLTEKFRQINFLVVISLLKTLLMYFHEIFAKKGWEFSVVSTVCAYRKVAINGRGYY